LKQTIAPNKTLIVDGPASVQITSGSAEVFGFKHKPENKITVQEGKRLPFYVLEDTTINVSLGKKGGIQEVEGNTTPQSWNQPIDIALSLKNKPATILILGKTDSGKSSFCTFLVNKLVAGKCKVAVLDGDLGQSDIGPSGTVGYGLTSKPIKGLQSLKLQNAFFVGVTSPILGISKTLTGLTVLKEDILGKTPDFVVVNTDGWVAGDIALRYKVAIFKTVKPDLVVAIQGQNELEPLIAILKVNVIRIEPSSFLSVRTIEKRKKLRELTYKRYLKGAKIYSYWLRQVSMEPKNANVKGLKQNMGLLVGLCDATNKFLGIGVLRSIDEVKQVLNVQTRVRYKPAKIFFGKIWLDLRLNEAEVND
jgi:polynucleotide 5'-hydroxyl-kinase GRC3/NOL9